MTASTHILLVSGSPRRRELLDMIGLDTQVLLCEAFCPITRDPRAAAPPLLRRMVAAGHLGRKSGRGFYAYEGGKMFGS